MKEIKDKISYGLLENDINFDETREEAVERLATEDSAYKELDKVVGSETDKGPLSEDEKFQRLRNEKFCLKT